MKPKTKKTKEKPTKKKGSLYKKVKEVEIEEEDSSPSSKKSLVIVESPGKIKTISKFLGKNYIVRASIGHVRDLPAKGLGIDVKNGFEPVYEILEDKQKVVKELKELAKKSDKI